ncbi:MAG: hypothetical protein AAFP26_11960 [Planctomycetota bacterium]
MTDTKQPQRGSPAPGYGSSRSFTQRIGLFAFGIAIGLLFLGFVQWRKQQATSPPGGAPTEAVTAPEAGPETGPEAGPETEPRLELGPEREPASGLDAPAEDEQPG